jgi:HAD superfamily hydrolase (TIGR01509 family)
MISGVMAKKCFLFDLDGTLVDSDIYHALAFKGVLGRSAPELLPRFDYHSIKGLKTRDVFAGFGFKNESVIAKLTAEKQKAYSSVVAQCGLPLIPGARELLVFLLSLNRRLYIVSSGSRISVELALRATHINEYFEGVVTSDETAESKPNPEIYRRCLEIHGLVASDCLAIEDSESGLAASTGAGIESVMINTQPVFPEAIETFPTLANFQNYIMEMRDAS